MKKTRLIGAVLAGIMAFAGVGALPAMNKALGITVYADSKLAAPTGIKAADTTDTTIKLTWEAVKGADAYRVFKINEKTGKYEKYKNVSGTVCNVSGLKRASSYKFKVAALIKSGNGYNVQTKSAAKTVKTMICAAPGYIGSIGYASEPFVDLEWGKVTDADAYRIYILDKDSGEYKVYKSAVDPETPYKYYSTEKRMFIYRLTFKDLSAGKHTFKVAGLVKKSDGTYSPQTKSEAHTVEIKKFAPKLASPTNVKIKQSGTTVTITWDPVKGASSYCLKGRSVLTSSGSANTYVPGGDSLKTTSYTASGKSGQTYYFNLYANAAEGSGYRQSEPTPITVTIK